jgi:hypothetical protein
MRRASVSEQRAWGRHEAPDQARGGRLLPRVSLAAFDSHVRPTLTPKRIGRRVLFLREDLEAWAESPSRDGKTRPGRTRKSEDEVWCARFTVAGCVTERFTGTRDDDEADAEAAKLVATARAGGLRKDSRAKRRGGATPLKELVTAWLL